MKILTKIELILNAQNIIETKSSLKFISLILQISTSNINDVKILTFEHVHIFSFSFYSSEIHVRSFESYLSMYHVLQYSPILLLTVFYCIVFDNG